MTKIIVRTITVLATVTALLTFGAVTPSIAGVNRWTTRGPEGGSIIAIASANGSVYAATNSAGMFKKENSFSAWRPINDGLPDNLIEALGNDPARPGIVYASAANRIFQTIDGGEHWTSVAQTDSNVTSFLFSVDGTVYATGRDGFFSSVDGGRTWQWTASPGLSLIAPQGGDLFARADDSLFVSHDRGASWMKTSPLPAVGTIGVGASEIYVAGVPPEAVIYRSVDSGRSWAKIAGTSAFVLAFLIDDAHGHLYLLTDRGVFESDDHGQRWLLRGDLSDVRSIAIDDSSLYAGTWRAGVFRWDSDSWIEMNEGLVAADVHDIDVASDGSSVYAAAGAQLFKSTDGGETWRAMLPRLSGYAALHPFTVAVHPTKPAVVFASDGAAGVLESDDGGTKWTQIHPSPAFLLSVARSDPSTIYASLEIGLARTTDSGSTWSVLTGLPTFYSYGIGSDEASIVIDPADASTVYAGHAEGLLKTTDRGVTWKLIDPARNVGSLCVDPGNSSRIYGAPDSSGVLRSDDGGATWTIVGLADKRVSALAIDPVDHNMIYAGTNRGEVYRSQNGGGDWSPFNEGLPSRVAIVKLSIDASRKRIYAGTSAGVYTYSIVIRKRRAVG